MTRLLLIPFLLLAGCASVGPAASVVGAAASVTGAWYSVTQAGVTVVSRECLWYRPVHLSVQGKAGLTRADREQVAYNNIRYDRECAR